MTFGRNATRAFLSPRGMTSLGTLAAMIAASWAGLLLLHGRGHVVVGDFAATLSLWLLMAPAMMLPSAAPLILDYVNVGEAARERGSRIPHPLVLASGYATAWLAFSLSAATWQSHALSAGVAERIDGRLAAGFLLAAAGGYQFTSLKDACLRACRGGLTTLMANWSERARDVFALGVRQGAWCVGCCWAMMLLMLAAPFAGLAWMAGLAAIMTAEKIVPYPTAFSRIVGGAMLIGSAAAFARVGGF